MRRRRFSLFYFFFSSLSIVQTQILFHCNFDNPTENCFTSEMNISSNIGTPNVFIPHAPLSDVTSSLKPTENGEICKRSYRIDTYTWEMNFCNRGYCPTETNPNSRCQTGYFAFVYLNDDQMKSFQLKIELDQIDGVNEQCLMYYYYMPNIDEKMIVIRKEESNGHTEVIDSVRNSPFNGWIQRKVPFNAQKADYKIHFQVQKPSSSSSIYIGFDEISIIQGTCDLAANNIMLSSSIESTSTMTTTVVPETSSSTILPDTSSSTTTPLAEVTSSSTTTPIDVESSTSETPDISSSTTTIVAVDTSSSTTTPVETESSTSETPEISSSSTTPVAVDTSSSATTPVETDTSTSETPDISSSATMTVAEDTSSPTTSIEDDSSTSETTDISSSITTSITAEISPSMTTPIVSDSSSSTITSESTDMTYSDESTTDETTDFSTMSSSVFTTSIETEPTESSSPSTTTNIIPSSTTEITDNLSTVSDTSSRTTTTTITSTPIVSTSTTTKDNIVVTTYDETLPYETYQIVIMAVVIPILWIAFIISFFRAKRSTNIIGGLRHPLNNFSRGGKTWGSYELESVSHA